MTVYLRRSVSLYVWLSSAELGPWSEELGPQERPEKLEHCWLSEEEEEQRKNGGWLKIIYLQGEQKYIHAHTHQHTPTDRMAEDPYRKCTEQVMRHSLRWNFPNLRNPSSDAVLTDWLSSFTLEMNLKPSNIYLLKSKILIHRISIIKANEPQTFIFPPPNWKYRSFGIASWKERENKNPDSHTIFYVLPVTDSENYHETS